jgi:2-keto-4-pentenoate hydratase
LYGGAIPLSPSRTARLADALIDARKREVKLESAPEACQPENQAEAWAVQDAVCRQLGVEIGGWKVGMAPEAPPVLAPIFAGDILPCPVRMAVKNAPRIGIEPEIAFKIGRDFPARGDGRRYTESEILEGIESAFAAIEIVNGRFAEKADVSSLTQMADNLSNYGLIVGADVAEWQGFDLAALRVTLEIGGKKIIDQTGGNPAGNPLTPLVWLANHLANRGGLRKGQVVTTGSFAGMNYAVPGDRIVAEFAGFGSADVELS